jgi:hypothetical protein
MFTIRKAVQMQCRSGSLMIARLCLGIGVGLSVAGCTLSDEPIPAGPVEVGPLPGDLTAELSPEPTVTTPAQDTRTPPSLTSEAPQASGTVTGAVRNGTGDASVPTDLEIELHGVTVNEAGDIAEFFTRTTTIGQDGKFSFDDVPFDVPFSAYIAQVVYGGVEFTNGAMIDPDSPTLDLSLTIYENTTDPAAISVDAMHLILSQHPDALLVNEVMVFSNASDRVYVSPEPVAGGRRGSVIVPVPADAYGLSFDEGELGGRFVEADGLIYDTRQVIPGQESHAVTVSYIVPFDGSGQLTLPITYTTRAVTVLIEEGIQVRSPVLADGGSQVIQEQAYHKYLAQNLTAGQSLDLQIGSGVGWVEILRIVLAVLVGVLGIASVLYWLLVARKRGRAPDTEPDRPPAHPDADRQELLRQIAALDEALEAGKINRFEWETRRAELKAELAETDYLLATPANAAHLRKSVTEAQGGSYEERELSDE